LTDLQSPKWYRRPWYAWLILLMFLLTIITMIYSVLFQTPKAKFVADQLESEFKAIAPSPEAKATHSEKSFKDSQALVLTRYSTSADYRTLSQHYDVELKKQGWRNVSEGTVTNWGRDLGGKKAGYCKGDRFAVLEYIGPVENGSNAFSFSVSWGLSEDCAP